MLLSFVTWDSRDLGQHILTSGQFFARRSIFLAWAAWPPLQTQRSAHRRTAAERAHSHHSVSRRHACACLRCRCGDGTRPDPSARRSNRGGLVLNAKDYLHMCVRAHRTDRHRTFVPGCRPWLLVGARSSCPSEQTPAPTIGPSGRPHPLALRRPIVLDPNSGLLLDLAHEALQPLGAQFAE